VRSGAGVNIADNEGQTPIFLAAEKGHLSCVNALSLADADLHHVDNSGKTALDLASTNAVKRHLRKAIAVDTKNDATTPLHIAVEIGDEGALARLLAAGVSVDTVTRFKHGSGVTALMLASSRRWSHKLR
jgi:ankyrin repeat protein